MLPSNYIIRMNLTPHPLGLVKTAISYFSHYRSRHDGQRVIHCNKRVCVVQIFTLPFLSFPQSQEEVCDLLHAAPFQNILPRVHVKGNIGSILLCVSAVNCLLHKFMYMLWVKRSSLCRGGASWCQDEALGGQIHSSALGPSDRALGYPTGTDIALTSLPHPLLAAM